VIREPDSALELRLEAADLFGFARIPKPAYHVSFSPPRFVVDKDPKYKVESTLVGKPVYIQ
jgi:hypothetical protein